MEIEQGNASNERRGVESDGRRAEGGMRCPMHRSVFSFDRMRNLDKEDKQIERGGGQLIYLTCTNDRMGCEAIVARFGGKVAREIGIALCPRSHDNVPFDCDKIPHHPTNPGRKQSRLEGRNLQVRRMELDWD